MSFFETLKTAPEDPIMSLPGAFAADSRKEKVNLGIGSYKTAVGQSYTLSVVRKAEAILYSKNLNKDYLPIEGDARYIEETIKLVLGDEKKRAVFGAQTVGGTSALHLAGEFIYEELRPQIFLPDPTWPNHQLVFKGTKLAVDYYPYYNFQTHELDFDALCKSIESMPERATILLHACCHNPSGVDPSWEQWQELERRIKKQNLFVIFDLAYQGFAQSLEKDVKPIQYFLEQDHEMFITVSFAKNMGLYGERAGALICVTRDQIDAKKVESHIKQIIRSDYSNPPLHSARIVETILSNPDLYKEWNTELETMKGRIDAMRETLAAKLLSQGFDFTFLNQQKGFFSFCGLDKDQVMRMKQERGIYLPSNGRINVAGLNPLNINYVVDSIISVLT